MIIIFTISYNMSIFLFLYLPFIYNSIGYDKLYNISIKVKVKALKMRNIKTYQILLSIILIF